MDKKLSLSFLWHMHQPYYCNDLSGEIIMPWVFLHAIKDYYDMPWYVDQFTHIKATFNLVPSLLVQLKAYEDEAVNDKFLKVLKREVFDLNFEEKTYLIEYLFFSNVQKMITPLPGYHDLYLKKEQYHSYTQMAEAFTDREILDLEVLFLLAWCGNYLRESNEVVKSLLQKERGYTQEDKLALLHALFLFIKEIIPYYKKLMDEGKIVVSTTPFNHPISPLLFDIKNAKQANSHTTLPDLDSDKTLKEDAFVQIDNAIHYYEKIFEQKPKGFWPAEGSVSYDFLDVLSQKGVQWACSDEEVLYKSGHFGKEDIYKNSTLHFKDRSINLFFRDKALSDLIGFSYSGWDEERAVDDLIQRLHEIYQSSADNQNVNIILDGENAWEHYNQNAMPFFFKLYEKLEALSWCQTTFFDDVLADNTIINNDLHALEPGSWISGNFDIWIGHPEKNRAWELIYLTKADFEKKEKSLDPPTRKKIQKEFLIAESSDWFWWYGDDHHTDLASTFDTLFRTHLMNIYTLMNTSIPQDILEPIIDTKEAGNSFYKHSANKITATIDGRFSNFFEWHGAGEIDLANELSSMSMHDFTISKILFGCDEHHCFIALKGDIPSIMHHATLEMDIEDTHTFNIPIQTTLYTDPLGIRCMSGSIIEIEIDQKLVKGKKINFKLFKEDKLLQLLPLYSKLEFTCLTKMKENWYI